MFLFWFRNKKNEKNHGRKKKEEQESSLEMLDGIIADADTVCVFLFPMSKDICVDTLLTNSVINISITKQDIHKTSVF